MPILLFCAGYGSRVFKATLLPSKAIGEPGVNDVCLPAMVATGEGYANR